MSPSLRLILSFQKINEKPQVIADYESGRAIPNNQVMGKIERAIGELGRLRNTASVWRGGLREGIYLLPVRNIAGWSFIVGVVPLSLVLIKPGPG